MWAFAGATTITRHRHPDRPLWPLRFGTVVFAGFGAALNFAHGLSAGSVISGVGDGDRFRRRGGRAPADHSGPAAHPCGSLRCPCRSRHAKRSENAIRKAALHRTVAVLDEDGGVHLLHEPGAVSLRRRWHGGVRLEEVPGVPQSQPAPAPGDPPSWPRPAPVLDAPASLPASPVAEPASRAIERAKKEAPSAPSDAPKSAPVRPVAVRQKGGSGRAAKRAKAERLLRANPTMPRAEVVAASGVSKRTPDRIRAELNAGAEVISIERRA